MTVLLLGAAACSKDTISATTTSDSGNSTTTVSDTSDSSQDGSTSSGDGDGDTADDSSITSGSFYAGPTDHIATNTCDPFQQDCPDGEKCVPYGSTGGALDANKCVPILGDGQPGDPCIYGGSVESTDDCGAESFCFDVMDVDGEDVGVCTEFCEGTADEPICPPGTGCLIANEGSTNLCLSTCDPVLQDCAPGLACFWGNTSFFCISTTQDIPLGDPCGLINDCAGGLVCLAALVLPNCDAAACCGSFCSLMEGAACAQVGTECSAFFEQGMAPLGYEDVGVCILPGA